MSTSVAHNRHGIFVYLSNEEFIGNVLRSGQPWEATLIDLMLKIVPPNKCAIDVGAHIGTHTVPYSRHFKHVYSFEAQSRMYDLLDKNVRNNNVAHKVTTFHNAAGDARRNVFISSTVPDGRSSGKPLLYDGDGPVNYGGIQLGKGTEPVEMVTIDSLGLDSIGFIKVDAEGCEPMVFYGARDTIARERPIILFERNYKTVTPDMIEQMGLPEEAYTFSIEKYCAGLGYYSIPIPVSASGDLLLLPC